MKSVKYLILIVALFFVFSLSSQVAQAAGETIYFFYGQGCPHCAKEEIFLQDLEKQYPDIEIKSFEVWYDQGNLDLLKKIGEVISADVSGVPFTLVGENYVIGFSSAQTTGQQIKSLVDTCRQSECPDVVAAIRSGEVVQNNTFGEEERSVDTDIIPESLSVPWLGEIDVKTVSLPVLTVIMGALDGFNPCAMWVLVFLIGLLIGMENKRRRWALGIVFLVSSAVVYYIFMAAWLNLLLFLGLVIWVRLAIGLLALGGGILNIKEYIKNPSGACKVTKQRERKLVFEKLKQIVLKKSFWLALVGIIVLAFAVNLVELICSAGFPAVYTQVLALLDLVTWQYYGYILLYVFVFLIDDIFVFVVAMITLEVTGLSSKYSRYSYLIGGIIMLIIGLLLLIKPELLMFG